MKIRLTVNGIVLSLDCSFSPTIRMTDTCSNYSRQYFLNLFTSIPSTYVQYRYYNNHKN